MDFREYRTHEEISAAVNAALDETAVALLLLCAVPLVAIVLVCVFR